MEAENSLSHTRIPGTYVVENSLAYTNFFFSSGNVAGADFYRLSHFYGSEKTRLATTSAIVFPFHSLTCHSRARKLGRGKLVLTRLNPPLPPPQAYEISNLAKDFGISREISGLLQRFPDFQISGGISGFPGISGRDFWDFRFRARFLGFPLGFRGISGFQRDSVRISTHFRLCTVRCSSMRGAS